MAEQTTLTQPEEAKAAAKPKQPRQLVRFTFYKLDPQWLTGQQRTGAALCLIEAKECTIDGLVEAIVLDEKDSF